MSYVDEELPRLLHQRLDLPPPNNSYGLYARVIIPAKASSVPPTPTHRMPSLEVQQAREQAHRREMFRLLQTGAIRQQS